MNIDCECVVIGAGVVGLAVAARLAANGHEVIILEAEDDFGSITSARNSEVIHAGIYYPKGSLKAQLCVSGKQMLYIYCQDRNVPFNQCGKLIVATNEKHCAQLTTIRSRARDNGVYDLEQINTSEAKSLEPELECYGALFSPSTGIIDSHALMVSLLGDAQNHGAVLVCRTSVLAISAISASKPCYQISMEDGERIHCRKLVNAAGHGACAIANSLHRQHQNQNLSPAMYKGNYFSLMNKSPFSRLIYPVPEQHGLGVHLTLDLASRARFGPDVEPVDLQDYSVNPERAIDFYSEIRKYWPGLPDKSLQPDYSGIRPRVILDGQLQTDFIFQDVKVHGMPGLVHALGVESPGLTSSLAIADHIERML